MILANMLKIDTGVQFNKLYLVSSFSFSVQLFPDKNYKIIEIIIRDEHVVLKKFSLFYYMKRPI